MGTRTHERIKSAENFYQLVAEIYMGNHKGRKNVFI